MIKIKSETIYAQSELFLEPILLEPCFFRNCTYRTIMNIQSTCKKAREAIKQSGHLKPFESLLNICDRSIFFRKLEQYLNGSFSFRLEEYQFTKTYREKLEQIELCKSKACIDIYFNGPYGPIINLPKNFDINDYKDKEGFYLPIDSECRPIKKTFEKLVMTKLRLKQGEIIQEGRFLDILEHKFINRTDYVVDLKKKLNSLNKEQYELIRKSIIPAIIKAFWHIFNNLYVISTVGFLAYTIYIALNLTYSLILSL